MAAMPPLPAMIALFGGYRLNWAREMHAWCIVSKAERGGGIGYLLTSVHEMCLWGYIRCLLRMA